MLKAFVFSAVMMALGTSYDVRHSLGSKRLYSPREEGHLHVSERFIWETYIGRCQVQQDQPWAEQVRACDEQLKL